MLHGGELSVTTLTSTRSGGELYVAVGCQHRGRTFIPRVSNLLPSMRAGPRTRPLQIFAVFRRCFFHRCHADVCCRWAMGRPGGARACPSLAGNVCRLPPSPPGGRDVLLSRGAANHHFCARRRCACCCPPPFGSRLCCAAREPTKKKKLGRP